MNLHLSWDLFIIVFFSLVMTYSMIIGRNSSIKVLIVTYMAILTADGLGNLFDQYLLPAAPSLQGESGVQALILIKIAVFVLTILLLVIKGGFRVDMVPEKSMVSRVISTLTFGFLNSGLMVSTLLVYLTGDSFVSGALNSALKTNLYAESELVQVMIDNYNVWVAVPAIALVIVSFFEARTD
ncbi:hypothetical protein HOD30_00145 [Candidatus Peregrinibacteria bacterium]|jgi:hypothetical protein|nr:hypothetical protein [Candidatus Peregrinibacteria bacterium]MBT4632331.1 hypothetical protein [Candidatus Peregrinibacteria bacterium]MBT5517135.1 hypothetical protein [Candidatus Peregrinibacteria bacterium]MBT5824045.1 hypothetical protein [Candidatus Peregrinibacteria bacterium]